MEKPEELVKSLITSFKTLSTYDRPTTEHVQAHEKQSLFVVNIMISENESVLEMLKIHGDERTRLPVLLRLAYLTNAKLLLEEKIKS